MEPPKHKQPALGWCVIALLIGIAARAACIFVLKTWQGGAGAYEHAVIARSLARGDGFRYDFFSDRLLPSSHQAPAVPFALSLLFRAFGPDSTAALAGFQVFNVLLAVLAMLSLGWTARLLWGRTAAVWAMLGCAVYPPLLYMVTRIQAVNWSVAFLAALVCCFVAARRTGAWKWAAACGLAGGLGAVGEPILVVPFGFCWLHLAFACRSSGPPHVSAGKGMVLPGMVLAVAAVVVAPWLIRNALVHRRLIFVKSTFWYVFWEGNHPGASGTDKKPVSPELRRALAWRWGFGAETERMLTEARSQAISIDSDLSPADVADLRALPAEAEKAAWFRSRALACLARQPGLYLKRCAARFVQFLWFDPTNPRSFVLSYRLPYLVLVGMAAWGAAGAAVRRNRPNGIALPVAAIAALVVVHTLVITSARFRLPVEAVLLLFAAAGPAALQYRLTRSAGCAER